MCGELSTKVVIEKYKNEVTIFLFNTISFLWSLI